MGDEFNPIEGEHVLKDTNLLLEKIYWRIDEIGVQLIDLAGEVNLIRKIEEKK